MLQKNQKSHDSSDQHGRVFIGEIRAQLVEKARDGEDAADEGAQPQHELHKGGAVLDDGHLDGFDFVLEIDAGDAVLPGVVIDGIVTFGDRILVGLGMERTTLHIGEHHLQEILVHVVL